MRWLARMRASAGLAALLVGPTGCTSSGKDSGPSESGDSSDSGDSVETAEVERCPDSSRWSRVSAGFDLTCGIHLDGCAECWGLEGLHESYYNEWEDYGELNVPAESFAQVALVRGGPGEGDPECGITTASTLVCWGREIGVDGTPEGTFAEVGVNTYSACAIDLNGGLVCWGYVVEPLPSSPKLRGLACGAMDCGAIDSEDAFVVWALGDMYNQVWEPQVIAGPFDQVSLGGVDCGLAPGGAFNCWYRWHPDEPAEFLPADRGDGWTSVCSYSASAVCALAADGHLACWSEDYDERVIADYPTDVSFAQIACGDTHACGVTVDSEIVCWGVGTYGATNVPE